MANESLANSVVVTTQFLCKNAVKLSIEVGYSTSLPLYMLRKSYQACNADTYIDETIEVTFRTQAAREWQCE